MLVKKRRTVDQIAASIRSRNHVDDFPSAERMKFYEQWKSGMASRMLDGIFLYQEKRTKIELHELEQAISYTYKRQLILFSVKAAAIYVVTAAVSVIQLM
ncbi:hypothetical protein [Vibrio viridaestus]|uniref:Uncharacterized protein n=1 Tax=Vibrio viridaestus TaxID=2487322 RepID=A0A3N9TES5_9VIBR|nr:hypothetical protein [Vibrio viridaestus]RQW62530.1 hypothetical protein EES38_12450 [Vibrio viridaestus]